MKNETLTHTVTAICGLFLIPMAFLISDTDNVVKNGELDYFVLSIALFFFLSGIFMAIYGIVKVFEVNDPLYVVRKMQWSDIEDFSYDVKWFDDRSTNCWGVVDDFTVHYVLLKDGTELDEQQLEFFFTKFEKEVDERINQRIENERDGYYDND